MGLGWVQKLGLIKLHNTIEVHYPLHTRPKDKTLTWIESQLLIKSVASKKSVHVEVLKWTSSCAFNHDVLYHGQIVEGHKVVTLGYTEYSLLDCVGKIDDNNLPLQWNNVGEWVPLDRPIHF